jgi:hypothetical protein
VTLAILGTGLVSPAGLTPRAHACVLWAGALPPAASPFVGANGEPVPVWYCPWIGARLGLAERMASMARTAAEAALRPLRAASRGELAVLLCLPSERAGLDADGRAQVGAAIAEVAGARVAATFGGAAGVFAALAEAEARVEAGAGAVAVVAVDSFIGEEALCALAKDPPSPWGTTPPAPAEGAAALLVSSTAGAERLGVQAIGAILHVGTAAGRASDENDLPADGDAMTSLLRRLPPLSAPAPLVFGQFRVDALRQAEWQLAVARDPSRVHPEYEMRSFESELGLVGDAAGAMDLVYGLAVTQHRATDMILTEGDPILAWAMSRDGLRGLAVATREP